MMIDRTKLSVLAKEWVIAEIKNERSRNQAADGWGHGMTEVVRAEKAFRDEFFKEGN